MTVSVEVLTAAPVELFTATSDSAVTFLSFCNKSVGTVDINMYVVPAGHPVDQDCMVYSSLSIPPKDTYQIYVGNEKLVLSVGDSIYANATVNSVVNTVLSYTSF